MPPPQKSSRLMNLLIAAPGVLAVGSAILWVVTLLLPSTFAGFFNSGRRFDLGSGYLYVNVEQPTSAATRRGPQNHQSDGTRSGGQADAAGTGRGVFREHERRWK